MKTNIIAVTGIGLLVLFVAGFASIFEIRLASAQVDATSSPPSSTDATTTPLVVQASASSTPTEDAASSTPPAAPADESASTTVVTRLSSTSTPAASAPIVAGDGPTLVHIIGTKYTDYFTDGKTVTAFPGDPAIDSHFNVPNAPIPTHEGLTWVHTTGQHLYDTPSGDLEINDYAQQSDGSYIGHLPASKYTDATSSVVFTDRFENAPDETEMKSAISKAIAAPAPAEVTTSTLGSTATDASSTTSNDAASSVPDASTTVTAVVDASTSTTNFEPTTSPSL